MQELLLIVMLAVVVFYWWDTAYTKELALYRCRYLCRNAELQLLDDTVMRQRIWLARSATGTLQLCRIYSFDYSDDDDTRWQGYIVTLGHHVAETSMDPRHVVGRTIDMPIDK
ncbi:MAG: DUF3301 domain-containing protein [Gammaproteobacteria bacterium]|nr:DUF3301 domain-containing protein [Gammaproteobacteria bacterium]